MAGSKNFNSVTHFSRNVCFSFRGKSSAQSVCASYVRCRSDSLFPRQPLAKQTSFQSDNSKRALGSPGSTQRAGSREKRKHNVSQQRSGAKETRCGFLQNANIPTTIRKSQTEAERRRTCRNRVSWAVVDSAAAVCRSVRTTRGETSVCCGPLCNNL